MDHFHTDDSYKRKDPDLDDPQAFFKKDAPAPWSIDLNGNIEHMAHEIKDLRHQVQMLANLLRMQGIEVSSYSMSILSDPYHVAHLSFRYPQQERRTHTILPGLVLMKRQKPLRRRIILMDMMMKVTERVRIVGEGKRRMGLVKRS